MSKQTEALKLAANINPFGSVENARARDAARKALTEQPAQQQEPVAWMYEFYADPGYPGLAFEPQRSANNTPLYTSPPPRKPWVGLTDEDKLDIWRKSSSIDGVINATASKLREKNA